MEYKNNKTANRRRYKSRYHSPHSYKSKKVSTGNRTPVMIGVATFLVLASLVLVFAFGDNIYVFLNNTFQPSALPLAQSETMGVEVQTEEPTETPTEAPTEEETEASTEPASGDDFTRLLSASGLQADSISGSQIIFVESSGTTAKVYTYEKTDGKWTEKFGVIDGYVGAGGVSASVGPYDDTTPTGTYNLEYAFGTDANPGTKLTYYAVEYGMKWVTDPSSVNYNRLCDSNTPEDWSECQELYEYTKSYPYAVVIGYNRNPVNTSEGCARFLHVADSATYGGVGISQDNLREILLWLDPAQNPSISIF